MAYKDKDKQREADRERQRRYRAERGRKAYPKGVTQRRDKQDVTESSVMDEISDTYPVIPPKVIPDCPIIVVPKHNYCDTPKVIPKRGKDIKAKI